MSKMPFCVVIGLCLAIATVHADVADQLLAYWPLDEGQGSATVDRTGNTPGGTLDGVPTWINGKFGKALEFDGIDDCVDCGNDSLFEFGTGSFTISAWINTTATGDETIFAKGGDDGGGVRYHLFVQGGVKMLVDDDITKYDPEGGIQVSDAQWHHIVGMRNGNTLRLYVDGVEDMGLTNHNESTLPDNYNVTGTRYGAYIGCLTSNNNGNLIKFFTGQIDDVALWNRALTPEEILFLWNDGEGTSVSSVFNEGAASGPYPAKEDEDLPRDTVLSWTPAESVETHDVYFSANFDDVNDGVALVSDHQDANSYDPGRLEFGRTYYWRVDEISGTGVVTGFVWSFTVEPFARPIETRAISATASSQWPNLGPEKTIDLSGLSDSDFHTTGLAGMWLSEASEPNTVWIQYEFDKAYKLYQMLVWNYNGQSLNRMNGIKEVQVQYSLDGAQWTSFDGVSEFAMAPGAEAYAANTTVDLGGVMARTIHITAKSNWSGGFTNQYGLSEVKFLMIPTSARKPNPESGAVDVAVDSILSWRSGREASEHRVYFSTDEQAVTEGTVEAITVNAPVYSPTLDLGMIHYWRVDEVNDAMDPSVWAGSTWSFSTGDKIVIDDFESYDDEEGQGTRIYESWIDGYGIDDNGSQVGHTVSPFAEKTIVHGGKQSMPLYYGGADSHADLQLDSDNWTRSGIKTLSILFHGSPGNTGQLYVKINTEKISYPHAATDIANPSWLAWQIDLTSLSGVANVTQLSIGVEAGGTEGLLYIDDIALYARPRDVLTPADPGSDGLLAQYSFEGNANDSSIHGLHGVVTSGEFVSPGANQTGSAIKFMGGTDGGYVDLGNPTSLDFGTADWAISAWFKTAVPNQDTRGVIFGNGGDDAGGKRIMLIQNEIANGTFSVVCDDDVTKVLTNSTFNTNDDVWHSVVAMRQATEIRLYIDGTLEATSIVDADYDLSGTSTYNAYIGAIVDNRDQLIKKRLKGQIDEVRIYGRALGDDEIRWLSGKTSPIDRPF